MRYASAMGTVVFLAGCMGPDGPSELPPDAAAPQTHLSLRGPCAEPVDEVAGIQFSDTIAQRQTSVRPLVATNDGPYDIEIRSLIGWSLEGPDAAEFYIDVGNSENQSACGFDPGVIGHPPLNVTTSCRLLVTFKPQSAGTKQASLQVLAQSIPLTGTAISSTDRVYASSTELFIDASWSYAPAPMYLTNLQATQVDTGSLTATGPFTVSAAPTLPCPSSLPFGHTCAVQLATGPIDQVGCPTGVLTNAEAEFQIPLRTWGP